MRNRRFVFRFSEEPKKLGFKFNERKPMITGPEETDVKSGLDDPDEDVALEEVQESHIEIARQVLKEMLEKSDADKDLIGQKLIMLDRIEASKLSDETKSQYIDDILHAEADEFAKIAKRFEAGLAGGSFDVE